MKINLSKKQREEVATKGFVADVLDEKLSQYVTKDYLKNEFTLFRKEFRKEINSDFERHVGALMESNQDAIMMVIEAFQNRFEQIENRLGYKY